MEVTVDKKETVMAVLDELPLLYKIHIVALHAFGDGDKLFTLDYVNNRFLQNEERSEMRAYRPVWTGNDFAF